MCIPSVCLNGEIWKINIHLGYTSESPRRGDSNEYPYVFKKKYGKLSLHPPYLFFVLFFWMCTFLWRGLICTYGRGISSRFTGHIDSFLPAFWESGLCTIAAYVGNSWKCKQDVTLQRELRNTRQSKLSIKTIHRKMCLHLAKRPSTFVILIKVINAVFFIFQSQKHSIYILNSNRKL